MCVSWSESFSQVLAAFNNYSLSRVSEYDFVNQIWTKNKTFRNNGTKILKLRLFFFFNALSMECEQKQEFLMNTFFVQMNVASV